MKIIVNTSNLTVGGGLQVALSFFFELKKFTADNVYHCFLSPTIKKQIDISLFPSNFHFYVIEHSPAKFKFRKLTISKLIELERSIDPDIVFTVFGPAYWKPYSPHLEGLANGWLYNPDTIAYKFQPFFKQIKSRFLAKLKTFVIKHEAQHFVVETDDARLKINQYLKINKQKISVVGNTCSSIFDIPMNIEDEKYIRLPFKKKDKFRLMLICHNYPHKNLSVIRKIIPHLRDCDVEFVLTIDEESYNSLFCDVRSSVINVGPIDQNKCPSIYMQSDALFFPTLLETFSASYPEAMKMQIPILTSNYSFSKDICGDAALYFDPLNPEDIAEKIKELVMDINLRKELVSNGNQRLLTFETSQSRAIKYIDLCSNIVKVNKS
ncbi:glycosyltransferase [Vibrio splendidus]